MTTTLEVLNETRVAAEPPFLADVSLLRPALQLQAAMSISLMLGTIPLSGLNPLAGLTLLPVAVFAAAALRVAKDPTRERSMCWLRRLEKIWIVHFVVNLLLAVFLAGMWLNPTQVVTGLLYPLWILKMTKEYVNVVPH